VPIRGRKPRFPAKPRLQAGSFSGRLEASGEPIYADGAFVRHRRPASYRAVLCVIGLAAACRSIIGLDEYAVEPAGSSSMNDDPDASDPQGGRDAGNGSGNDSGGNDGSVPPDDDGGSLPNGGASGAGGDGGSPPMGGAGAGGAVGGGGNAGAGGNDQCGPPPQPSACVPGPGAGSCDGICQADSCVHECVSPQDCGGSFEMSTIVACGPPSIEFPCILDCRGGGPCPAAVEVSCPDVAPCMVQCIEPGSCTGAFIRCKGGGCQVNCGAEGCDDTTEVICGSGPCIVFCEPGADVAQTEGPSCDAQKVGCGQ
jgi:hypothetical protein